MTAIKKIMRVFLFLVFAGIIFLNSSCIKEGNNPCPNYLKIIYDYNMEFVDLFHRQGTFLSIFMFDAETGVLVREVKQRMNPFPENYTIKASDEWLGQRYHIVVWAGLDSDSYEFPTLAAGVSTIEDFQLKVKDYENQLVERGSALEPLWHGTLTDVMFTDEEEKTFTVSLMKDTKKFRLVVQNLDENETISKEEVDIRILSADGWYDNNNNVLDPIDRAITYLPYYIANDAEVGVVAEMNSLRLITDDKRTNRLHITDKITGEPILDISLITYLNALRLLQYSDMPLQEYLDREDEYYILVFLQRKGNEWIAAKIEINDWVIRIQDIE